MEDIEPPRESARTALRVRGAAILEHTQPLTEHSRLTFPDLQHGLLHLQWFENLSGSRCRPYTEADQAKVPELCASVR